MNYSRLAIFPILLVLILALVAACGGGGSALSEEEYFAKMDEIDKDLTKRFDEVFGDGEGSAKDGAAAFSDVAGDARTQYGDVKPPSELKDEHDQIVAAIDLFIKAISSAADNAEEDALLFDLFENEALAEADERTTTAFCALQDIADEKGIDAQVGCEGDGDEESIDPSTLPAEEATEVLIEDFAFDPPHIEVSVGDTVTWTQGADDAPHTATADDDSFDSDNLSDEGETFEFTFEEAGEFSYLCSIHPEMLGLVTVIE